MFVDAFFILIQASDFVFQDNQSVCGLWGVGPCDSTSGIQDLVTRVLVNNIFRTYFH